MPSSVSRFSLANVPLPGLWLPALDAPACLVPLGMVKVSAGFPSPAADYEEKRLDINEYLIRNPVSTFFFPVQGDSMEGAEIFDGDILVVDRSIKARHGHIVVGSSSRSSMASAWSSACTTGKGASRYWPKIRITHRW